MAHTGIGFATHHASAIFWALPFEAWLAHNPPRSLNELLRGAAAMSALAAAMDYGITPERFTPGCELVVSKKSVFGAFAGLALGVGRRCARLPGPAIGQGALDTIEHWHVLRGGFLGGLTNGPSPALASQHVPQAHPTGCVGTSMKWRISFTGRGHAMTLRPGLCQGPDNRAERRDAVLESTQIEPERISQPPCWKPCSCADLSQARVDARQARKGRQ